MAAFGADTIPAYHLTHKTRNFVISRPFTGHYLNRYLNNPTDNEKRPPMRKAFSISTGVGLFLFPSPFQVGEVVLSLLHHDLELIEQGHDFPGIP